MKRLALILTALAMSTSAHAGDVYEMTCTKSEITPRTMLPTYVAMFRASAFTGALVIDTGVKRITYSVDRVVERYTYVDVYGRTPFGTTYAARFPTSSTAKATAQFASFNGNKQITDHCEADFESSD